MYGLPCPKMKLFFRNIHTKWQTNKNCHLWKSRCTIQSYFWFFKCIFAKVTRVFLLIKSIFEWKQKWLPLLSFQWYFLTSKIFWFKLHRPFFKCQVPDIDKWCGRNELQETSFVAHFSSGCKPKLWGGPKFFSFGFVVAIIKIWTISLVSLIWDPFQRTCRERPKSCTAFFSPQKFSWKNVILWGKGSGKKKKKHEKVGPGIKIVDTFRFCKNGGKCAAPNQTLCDAKNMTMCNCVQAFL